jgi:hypothetical protein
MNSRSAESCLAVQAHSQFNNLRASEMLYRESGYLANTLIAASAGKTPCSQSTKVC